MAPTADKLLDMGFLSLLMSALQADDPFLLTMPTYLFRCAKGEVVAITGGYLDEDIARSPKYSVDIYDCFEDPMLGETSAATFLCILTTQRLLFAWQLRLLLQ